VRGVILAILTICILCSFVSAVTGPISYNGKQYYVVTSANPSEDTGNEVCAAVGMVCIGYTETSDAVCKLAHPGASSVSSVSGDMSGVYCNGAPQAGVCSAETDTCHTCPACTASVTCSQKIGGLYREMYVECGAGKCKISVPASNVQDLLNQITSINSQLKGCPQTIPAAGSIIKDGNTILNIQMNSGTTSTVTITIAGHKITGVTSGAASVCAQTLTISENDANTALKSTSIGQAALFLLGQGKLKVSGCNILSKVKLFFLNPIAKFTAKKAAPSMPPAKPAPNCGNIGEQCNDRGCFSGICAAPKELVDGQWRYVNYRCLDQSDWDTYCQGHGNTPPAWNCLTGPCG